MSVSQVIYAESSNWMTLQDGGFVIEKVMRLLEDRQWHCLQEIRDNCSLCEAELQRVLVFLKNFEFLVVDDCAKRARLDQCLLELPV